MKSTSSPRSTAPLIELDSRFAAQLDTVNSPWMISFLLCRLLCNLNLHLKLDQFQLGITNSSVSGNPGVRGYSVSQTEPVSLQHPVSTERQ